MLKENFIAIKLTKDLIKILLKKLCKNCNTIDEKFKRKVNDINEIGIETSNKN